MDRNLSADSFNLYLSSISNSTFKQYNSSWRKWWNFTLTRNFEPYHPSEELLLEFFTAQSSAEASYSSLNTDRAALLFAFDVDVSKNFLFKRLFKQIYNLRLPKPRYNVTQNPDQVLDYLKSLGLSEELTSECLTFKLSMLLALVTAQRVQTLSLIEAQNIEKCSGQNQNIRS